MTVPPDQTRTVVRPLLASSRKDGCLFRWGEFLAPPMLCPRAYSGRRLGLKTCFSLERYLCSVVRKELFGPSGGGRGRKRLLAISERLLVALGAPVLLRWRSVLIPHHCKKDTFLFTKI